MGVSILCPVIKVRIVIGSKILDDVKRFTGFVMRALFEGYSVADIDAVIGLGEAVVTEEIEYLRKIGFVSGEENSFSESGKEYCALMAAVDSANERGIDAYVELFSGKILPYILEAFTDSALDEEAKVLKRSVYISSLYERDYSETKEFIFGRHGDLFDGLNEKQIESVYTQLEFDKGSESFISLTIENIPPLDYEFTVEPKKCINLRRSFVHIRWSAAFISLENYLHKLDLLETLSETEDGILISQFGHSLLKDRRKESNFNAALQPLIYDNFTREFVDTIPDGNYGEYDIELSCQFDVSAKRWQTPCIDYFKYHIEQNAIPNLSLENPFRVARITCDSSYYIQRIPFDLFLADFFDLAEGEVQKCV